MQTRLLAAIMACSTTALPPLPWQRPRPPPSSRSAVAPAPVSPTVSWSHEACAAASLVVLITLSLHYAPAYRSMVDKCLGNSPHTVFYLSPLVLLVVYDVVDNPLHRFFPFPDVWANYVLRVAGGYGIAQVLAQDLGIRTGALQRDLIQQGWVQFILLWGGAFSITGYRSEGLVSALLYFVLRQHVSAGETSGVCFEDV